MDYINEGYEQDPVMAAGMHYPNSVYIYIYIIPGKNSKNDGIQDFRANFRVVFSRGASLVVLYIFLQSGAYT